MSDNPTQQKIENFFRQFPLSSFNKGDTVLTAHKDPSGLFFLESGFVRQYVFTNQGSELTMHFFKSNSFFPLFWAINDLPNRFQYQALTPVEVRICPKEKFLEFIKSDPEILFNLSSRLLFGLDGLLTRVESLASSNAKQRTIGILIFLAKHFGVKNDSGVTFSHPFTHEDIANLTGLTRETTSRELEKLAKSGAIEVKNHIISIFDLQKLV